MRRSTVIVGLLSVVGCALSLAVLLWPKPADRLPTPTGYHFWAGINYPWKSYQDFGTGGWGYSGVSSPEVYQEIDTDFANMAAAGFQVVKWRVFNDARYDPKFAADGTVIGYDDVFLKDVDAALEIAAKHDVYLVFSLFNSGLWTTSCTRDGVQLGGHADWMTDPAKRKSVVDKAIVPLVDHVAASHRVVGFEVLAEPEWGIAELHTDQDSRLKVPLAGVQAFVKDATDAIHQHGGGLVTVESNRPTNMKYWMGLGLDYYTFSWYDWMQPYDPLDVAAASYGLDRPVVLGEYPIQNSAYYDSPQEMEIAFGRGYAGAFVWSYGSGDKYGTLRDAHDAYVRWLQSHWQTADISNGRIRPPSADVALVPPAFSYQNVTVTGEQPPARAETAPAASGTSGRDAAPARQGTSGQGSSADQGAPANQEPPPTPPAPQGAPAIQDQQPRRSSPASSDPDVGASSGQSAATRTSAASPKPAPQVAVNVGLFVRDGGTFHVQFYFYPFDGKAGPPVADRTLVLQNGAQGTLHLSLAAVAEGKLYRVSMAIFDERWTMRKWFDSVAIFSLKNGQVSQPTLSDLDAENPCAKAP